MISVVPEWTKKSGRITATEPVWGTWPSYKTPNNHHYHYYHHHHHHHHKLQIGQFSQTLTHGIQGALLHRHAFPKDAKDLAEIPTEL